MNARTAWVWGLVALFVSLVSACGCGDDDDDDDAVDVDDDDDDDADDDVDDDSGDDDTWPPLDDDADDDAALPPSLASRPELLDWSSWFEDVDGANPPRPRAIGGFGVGNGRCFTMTAGQQPLTTWTNLIGPDYQKNLRFFSEKTLTLYRYGEPVAWERERAYRVRETGVVVIRQDAGDVTMWTVDFAPEGEGVDGTPAADTLERIVVVHNRGDADLDGLTLSLGSVWGHEIYGVIGETIHEDGKNLAMGFGDAKGAGSTRWITSLAPGDEYVAPVIVAFARPGGDEDDARNVYSLVLGRDPWDLLDATLDAWTAFSAENARVTAPDERVGDLIEGMAVTLRNQTTHEGAITQMSEYSGAWLRDIMGPAVFLPQIGRAEEFERMLDYYWAATLVRGNFSNAMPVDQDISDPPPQPDWAAMGTLTGKIGAESPSYHILHYRELLNATGDWTRVEERYGMLRHALIHQNFQNVCLLPFSGDETFRPAMAVAFGDGLSGDYQDTHLSANSSFLFVAAAEFMVTVAEHMGLTDDADEYQALADDVRDCAESYYWLDDAGYYSPMILKDTYEPLERPFEDINATPLWIGYQAGEDAHAKENIVNAFGALERNDGVFHSPISPTWAWLAGLADVHKGVTTGMVYGYDLDALARIDHPWAEDAFLAYEKVFHKTGNVSEGLAVDDWGRFAYLYEPFGYLVDLTARYRSWEGPIDAAAMLRYLFGIELDARAGRVRIAPHLPDGWAFAQIEGARVGDATFDLRVENDEEHQEFRAILTTDAPLTVDAKMSVIGEIGLVTVNGEAVPEVLDGDWGRTRATLHDLPVGAGETLTIEIVRAGK